MDLKSKKTFDKHENSISHKMNCFQMAQKDKEEKEKEEKEATKLLIEKLRQEVRILEEKNEKLNEENRYMRESFIKAYEIIRPMRDKINDNNDILPQMPETTAKSTQKNEQNIIKAYKIWAKKKNFSDITKSTITQYLCERREDGLRTSTLATMSAVLQKMLKRFDPKAKIKRIKGGGKKIRFKIEDKKALGKIVSRLPLGFSLMARIMAWSGMRHSAVCEMNVEDFAEKMIIHEIKVREFTIKSFPKTINESIKEYIGERKTGKIFFPEMKRGTLIKKFSAKLTKITCGISKAHHYSGTHMFRHYTVHDKISKYVTHIRKISQNVLGHKGLGNVDHYIDFEHINLGENEEQIEYPTPEEIKQYQEEELKKKEEKIKSRKRPKKRSKKEIKE
jgi:integrase